MNTNVVVLPTAAAPAAVAAPPRVRAPTLTTDKAVEKFVALRDKIAEIKKRHVMELAPYNGALAALEGWLLDDLNTAHVEQMRALSGTVYKSVRTSASVVSWTETLDFIKATEAWELLEARVSKIAVEAIIEETKQPVPGVKIAREIILNVRRA